MFVTLWAKENFVAISGHLTGNCLIYMEYKLVFSNHFITKDFGVVACIE